MSYLIRSLSEAVFCICDRKLSASPVSIDFAHFRDLNVSKKLLQLEGVFNCNGI